MPNVPHPAYPGRRQQQMWVVGVKRAVATLQLAIYTLLALYVQPAQAQDGHARWHKQKSVDKTGVSATISSGRTERVNAPPSLTNRPYPGGPHG